MYHDASSPSSVDGSPSSFPVSCLFGLVLPRNTLAHESSGADFSRQIGYVPQIGISGVGKDPWMLSFVDFARSFSITIVIHAPPLIMGDYVPFHTSLPALDASIFFFYVANLKGK